MSRRAHVAPGCCSPSCANARPRGPAHAAGARPNGIGHVGHGPPVAPSPAERHHARSGCGQQTGVTEVQRGEGPGAACDLCQRSRPEDGRYLGRPQCVHMVRDAVADAVRGRRPRACARTHVRAGHEVHLQNAQLGEGPGHGRPVRGRHLAAVGEQPARGVGHQRHVPLPQAGVAPAHVGHVVLEQHLVTQMEQDGVHQLRTPRREAQARPKRVRGRGSAPIRTPAGLSEATSRRERDNSCCRTHRTTADAADAVGSGKRPTPAATCVRSPHVGRAGSPRGPRSRTSLPPCPAASRAPRETPGADSPGCPLPRRASRDGRWRAVGALQRSAAKTSIRPSARLRISIAVV